MKTYYVYILECSNNSYYTGVTNNMNRRLHEHDTGANRSCFTYDKRPVKLVYVQSFMEIENAIKWEKQLKGWSRKKKQAVIHNNWEKLPALSKNKQQISILFR